MNSLVNYGSDDDLDDSSDERSSTATYETGKSTAARKHQADDVNYDEVQMSVSEGSDAEEEESRPLREKAVAGGSKEDYNYRDSSRYVTRDRDNDRNDKGRDRKERSRDREDTRSRDDDRTRDHYKNDRDRSRDRKDDRRGKSKDRSTGRDDKYRDRKDKDRRRSRSRDRKSRSPRDRRSRSRDRRSRSRDRRSRSRSPRKDDRFRNDRGNRGSYRRFDRNRSDNLARTAVAKNNATETPQGGQGNNFFIPGITGKYREQIEKRKLLWQKKDTQKPETSVQAPSTINTPRATKVWEATTFAQDTDGKVANKFKRLMGIRQVSDGSQPATEVLKKQEEMFSSMEQQYEVARTATHTMRGVGLGFGSFQR